ARLLEESNPEQVFNISTALMSMLLKEAGRAESLAIEVPAESDINLLIDLCFKLIDSVPDGGNTPEFITGQLLESYQEQINSGIQVDGHKEGASTTSTTSNKPGDITEKSADGAVLAVYEITMKPFDDQRISDSEDTVKRFIEETGQQIQEINVICRESDVHPDVIPATNTKYHLGTFIFRNITYQFYEIHLWIVAALSRLIPSNRAMFYKSINEYIAAPNTSEKVKKFWKQLHERGS
ncbi:unnamed protein product, partial [marine sediment metagenome]